MPKKYSDQQEIGKSSVNNTKSATTEDNFSDQSTEAQEVRQLQGTIDNSPSQSLPDYEEGENPYDAMQYTGLTDEQNEAFVQVRQEKAGNFKSLNDGSLQGLASALFQQADKVSTLNDNDLIDIIKNNFESNWFKAKKCLTTDFWPGVNDERPTHDASISLMQALVEMRGRVWDKFVKAVQPKILEKVAAQKSSNPNLATLENPADLDKNFGLKEAVGSESVTSDIDLSAKGENTEIGVAMINSEFRSIYNTEPGGFFDINVYSSDWMFKPDEKITAGVVEKTPQSEAMATTGQDLTPENQKKKDEVNEVWSMVKIRRNMTSEDWDAYKAQMLEDMTSDQSSMSPEESKTESAKLAAMHKKFGEVESEYTDFHNKVAQGVEEMKSQLTEEEKGAVSAFANQDGVDEMAEESMEMAASNREYERIILVVKEKRLQIKRLQDANDTASRVEIENLMLEVHSMVAKGLTYANEVYATEGAVLHTVFGGRGAAKELTKRKKAGEAVTDVKYLLNKEQYLQSLNENVGDTLHSLNHNKNDPQYAVYRAGKYIARLCSAANELIGKPEAQTIPSYSELLEIGNAAVHEKAGDAGKDPLAVREPKSYFSKYEASDLNLVKSLAMSLGAKASAVYKNSKEE